MQSMTGLGVAETPLDGGLLLAEIRSLNHRFVEVRVRMPPELSEHAFFVEQRTRERRTRGRYDVTVRLDTSASTPRLDTARARALYADLCRLRDELAPGTELPLTAVAALPGLIVTGPSLAPDPIRRALGTVVDRALTALDEMRRLEGATLHAELLRRLESARHHVAAMTDEAPRLAEAVRSRLQQRLDKLLGTASSAEIDPLRLEAEVALLAERSDVAEELVRLDSHLAQFESLLGEDEPVGRRLDFLLQEMGRETNTIGAKCQDADVSHRVVELKAELERMREQVQNVE